MKYIKETILKWLFQTGALEFRSWKSLTRLEQYTVVYFMGQKIKTFTWSDMEMLEKTKY